MAGGGEVAYRRQRWQQLGRRVAAASGAGVVVVVVVAGSERFGAVVFAFYETVGVVSRVGRRV